MTRLRGGEGGHRTTKKATAMKHAFISYVRNNKRKVQRLCDELTAQGARVWLDRRDLRTGSRWQDAIKEAIQHGDFFIACFSKQLNERDENFMNQELAWAIDRLARFASSRTWFIPVKLNPCEIPNRRIGGGERLRDLQYAALYPTKREWDAGIKRIIEVIQPVPLEIQELIQQLDGRSAEVRSHAVAELGRIGRGAQAAVPALM
jgi:hypothetical protein